MGAAARKNPAALLRCLQTMQGQSLLPGGATVKKVAYTETDGECSEENAKYYACDPSKEYVVQQSGVRRAVLSTTGSSEVTLMSEPDGLPAARTVRSKSGRAIAIPGFEVAVL